MNPLDKYCLAELRAIAAGKRIPNQEWFKEVADHAIENEIDKRQIECSLHCADRHVGISFDLRQKAAYETSGAVSELRADYEGKIEDMGNQIENLQADLEEAERQ